MADPQDRKRAVAATIEASRGLLGGADRDRIRELAVFAEDETIPFGLVARLWAKTGGLDALQAAQVCAAAAKLNLVTLASGADAPGGVALHDVIRDFLRHELGQRLTDLHRLLVEAVAAGLPAPVSLTGSATESAESARFAQVAWWELADGDRHLWDHLVEHLREAGQDADAVAGDLRWVGARLVRFGPAAPAVDLAVAGTPRSARLRVALERASHLLAPTEPAEAVVDILPSRVAADPDWGPAVDVLRAEIHRPRLVNRGGLPDLAPPALRCEHAGSVTPRHTRAGAHERGQDHAAPRGAAERKHHRGEGSGQETGRTDSGTSTWNDWERQNDDHA